MHYQARHIFRTIACLTALAALAGAAMAGTLSPPNGPVAPTFKTLNEVEPRIAVNAVNTPGDADSLFKISQPGSYYLVGNVTGVLSKAGIEIAASGVTLDLSGFDLQGAPGSLDGVRTDGGGVAAISVINGSVRAWGGDGLDLTATTQRTVVREVQCIGNSARGITVNSGSIVSACTAGANGQIGIEALGACTLRDCNASGNGNAGISADEGSTVSGCAASANSGVGIVAGINCVITGCVANSNAGIGIQASAFSRVVDCASRRNSAGISVGFASVSGCIATGNTTDGIIANGNCLVIANSCIDNGFNGTGAGIRVESDDSRIEGNKCTGADIGIDVNDPGNIIVKNACSDNAFNWSIVADNIYGPIIDRTNPGTLGVSGNGTAAGTLGSTDSNANFSF